MNELDHVKPSGVWDQSAESIAMKRASGKVLLDSEARLRKMDVMQA